ncbi:MAG TPA: hypothetical protein VHX92_08380 [Rhizomicrobium sp.]|nr:hypothetical protein [Rhizomicrobium sp.]
MRAFICLAFLGSVVAGPAMAQTSCVAPDQPASIDGATATLDQLKASISAAKQFMASSDAYQGCLGKDIDTQKAAATPDKPFDKAIATRDMALADSNQKMKENVGTSVNAAIAAYKKAHPAP